MDIYNTNVCVFDKNNKKVNIGGNYDSERFKDRKCC